LALLTVNVGADEESRQAPAPTAPDPLVEGDSAIMLNHAYSRALPIPALAGLTIACSSSAGGAAITTTADPCTSDFDCPANQSCAPTGNCVHGIVEDNHLSGTISLVFDAIVMADAGVNLGAVAVSGAIAGNKVEFSTATAGGTDPGSPDLVDVVINGRGPSGPLALSFVVPADVAARTGAFTIDPDVTFTTDEHAYLYVSEQPPDGGAGAVVAYSLSGQGSIEGAASNAGQMLVLKIDVALALPKPVPPCRAICTSQADCGQIAGGTEGLDYPQCFEEWAGGIRLCERSCIGAGAAACQAAGGECELGICYWPRCNDQPPAGTCTTLNAQNCQFCCDQRSDGAGTVFNAGLYAQCACSAVAPCGTTCAPACASPTGDPSSCVACVGASTDSCFAQVVQSCTANASCNTFLSCQASCQS
jgi:hypothetical protein